MLSTEIVEQSLINKYKNVNTLENKYRISDEAQKLGIALRSFRRRMVQLQSEK